MKNGWLYGLVFGSTWIAIKMLAFALNWKLDEIQIFVLLNMAFLTAAIALFMYRKKRNGTSESNILTDIKAGLSVGLPYTLIVSFFLFFYYRDIYPEFNQKKRAAYEQKMDSPAEIAAIRKGNSALENKSDAEIVEMARKKHGHDVWSSVYLEREFIGVVGLWHPQQLAHCGHLSPGCF